MKRVLFVGESPYGCTGNCNFMRGVTGQVDREKYSLACFAVGTASSFKLDIFQGFDFSVIPADGSTDKWNGNKLLSLIRDMPLDAVIFIGIDIWVYAPIFHEIQKLQQVKEFKTIHIFPYDVNHVRPDWINWINMMDMPCVYSEYGYNLLKDHVPNLRYFRPPLFAYSLFRKYTKEQKDKLRHAYFPTVGDGFLYGFVGNNQVRKDPQKVLAAFSQVKEKHPDSYLYMHTNMQQGVYNLIQSAIDAGLKSGDIVSKSGNPAEWVDPQRLVEIYNCFDALVNCSLQEGLSWTLLEAMLCGVPIIGSDTTAQTELLEGVSELVPCNEDCHLPLYTKGGESWVKSQRCREADLVKGMLNVLKSPKLRERYSRKGTVRAKDWLNGVNNINEVLEDCFNKEVIRVAPEAKIDGVIFAQHSSAGDVLMTTKCFKGLKEIYDGKPLVYMTQQQYMDIVEGNPYIDKVVAWDEQEYNKYLNRLNPHNDRIAPGHWGRNSNSLLSDFYWKILMVQPEPIYIDKVRPEEDIALQIEKSKKPICIVHTTGGDPVFRTYKYMKDVCKALKDEFFTVQVGSNHDYPADAELCLSGKLSFRQTAWVIDQASLSINVDSFVSHLSGALGVSQITLFGSGNAHVVRPDQTKGALICLVPDYIMDCPGLGPCSGSVRNCPIPCTNTHSPEKILDMVHKLKKDDWIKRNTEQTTSNVDFIFEEAL